MKRSAAVLASVATASAVLLGTLPAQAHGGVHGGVLAGLGHPLFGLDHLFLLISVGAAASFISARLLIWALGGAVLGAILGAAGMVLPAGELLAALAISSVGLLILATGRLIDPTSPWVGVVVAAAVGIHGLLHGGESPKDGSTLLWWTGALVSSVLVSGASYLILRKLPLVWTRWAAVAFLLIGAVLAFGPLGLLAGGAGT
ncbi:HupE/UreJ family protein [Cyanobium sp. ATX 6F1]|uniref:HupE/UreJ family protein n=1 Tax=Cyanobium sp. ATX 6F1 TaxID=2823702 RepID=UPI0020CDD855|nr:HupE/UreJ family protein [Cyanobium sp. ATX 6F1]MCP9914899.1 HupE/UreJ family protein [Cyanobium sp. ATX 6F1]